MKRIFFALLVCTISLQTEIKAQTPVDAADIIALEKFEKTNTFVYNIDVGNGLTTRSILTKPRGASGKLPAIYLIQWLSCSPVTLAHESTSGWTKTLRGLVENSGMVFIRTEKAGHGDTSGPPCSELGYDEEIKTHKAALKAFMNSEHVDPDNVILFGASMGGTMAPIVAQDFNVDGLMIWGTTGISWLEHMIAIDRRSMHLNGTSPEKVNEYMDEHIIFHTEYLAKKRKPTEIIKENPHLKNAWDRMLGTENDLQYGRGINFHHQAHSANWEAAWEKVNVPVLVVNGEYDWIMGPEEHQRIIDIVSKYNPGKARLKTIPKMNHHFQVFDNIELAFKEENGKYDESGLMAFLEWLKEFDYKK